MLKNFLIITTIGILALSPLFFVNTAEAKIVPDCGKVTIKLGPDGKPAVDSKGKPTNEKEFRACDFGDAMQLIRNIINFLLFVIATPIAGLVICYAGFQLLTSGGSSEKKTKAKHVLMNMILGYVIALGAWLIVNTIFSTFKIAPCQNWLGKDIPDCEVPPSK
jgi:type IV secretory pathway VirB2 component (pilin)